MRKTVFLICLTCISAALCAQKLDSARISNMINLKFADMDIGYLWRSPDTDLAQVGFIGLDYTRFQIHISKVERSRSYPNSYEVVGKTKVMNEIREFRGVIQIDTVVEIQYLPELFNRDTIRSAGIRGQYVFWEKMEQPHAGTYQGKFHIEVYIDQKYKVHYDDLLSEGDDSYSNNQFTGFWIGYDVRPGLACNWGDYRIDSCDDLDVGVGGFYVNEKYLKNGWEDFWNNPPSTIGQMEEYIRDKKRSRWWEP